MFLGAATLGKSHRRALFQQRTNDLVKIVEGEPGIAPFILDRPKHSWKVAGRFLSQTQEMGFSPMEDLQRCASLALVGWISLGLGLMLLGLEALPGQPFHSEGGIVLVDLALLSLGVGLLYASRSAAVDFMEGTLAGMKERVKAFKEAQEKVQSESKMDLKEQARLTTELKSIVDREGGPEGSRIYDATRVRQMFQESATVQLLILPEFRANTILILKGIGNESNETVKSSYFQALESILRQITDEGSYAEIDSEIAPVLAAQAVIALRDDNLTSQGQQLLNVAWYMRSKRMVEALLAVIRDAMAGRTTLLGTLDAVSNSYLGDYNEEFVKATLKEISTSRADVAAALQGPFSNLERRRRTNIGSLERVPLGVRVGKMPRTLGQ